MKKDFHKLTHFITMMASVWKGLCGQSENYKTTKCFFVFVFLMLRLNGRKWTNKLGNGHTQECRKKGEIENFLDLILLLVISYFFPFLCTRFRVFAFVVKIELKCW